MNDFLYYIIIVGMFIIMLYSVSGEENDGNSD